MNMLEENQQTNKENFFPHLSEEENNKIDS